MHADLKSGRQFEVIVEFEKQNGCQFLESAAMDSFLEAKAIVILGQAFYVSIDEIL